MSRKQRKNVGVIGLGIIGTRVAAGLRAAGYQAYVWNRSAKPAPNFLGSPAEVADAAEIIQVFVADAAALFEVLEAMGDSLTPQHIIVCNATVGPEAVLEAAQIVESKGAQFLDAPFTGSKLAAEKRQLVYYVGGSEHTFLKVKPVLEATSKAIVRIGEVGHAATVKVVTNMISAVTTQVLAESLAIVQKAGLEPEVLAAALEHNACRSGVIDLKLPKMITGDYDPHFSLKHMFKDVQLGIHMANALDIEVPATTVTAGVMYGAINQGWADSDFSVLFKHYEGPESSDEFPALTISTAPAGESAGEEGASEILIEEKAQNSTEAKPAGNGEALVEGLAEAAEPAPEITEPASASGDGATSKEEEPAIAAPGTGAVSRSEEATEPVPSPESALKETFTPPSDEVGMGGPPEQTIVDTERPASSPSESENVDRPAEGEPEAPPRPNNFVRRWFVARSGG